MGEYDALMNLKPNLKKLTESTVILLSLMVISELLTYVLMKCCDWALVCWFGVYFLLCMITWTYASLGLKEFYSKNSEINHSFHIT